MLVDQAEQVLILGPEPDHEPGAIGGWELVWLKGDHPWTYVGTDETDSVIAIGGSLSASTYGGNDVVSAGPGDDIVNGGEGRRDVAAVVGGVNSCAETEWGDCDDTVVPPGVRPARAPGQSASAARAAMHLGVDPGIEGGALTSYVGLPQRHQPVEPDLARAVLAVPVTGADVHPVPAGGRLLGLVAVVVLARHHQAGDDLLGRVVGVGDRGDDEHRPVLALGRVVLVGHPGPADLAWVGSAVGLGGVVGHVLHVSRGSAPSAPRPRTERSGPAVTAAASVTGQRHGDVERLDPPAAAGRRGGQRGQAGPALEPRVAERPADDVVDGERLPLAEQ